MAPALGLVGHHKSCCSRLAAYSDHPMARSPDHPTLLSLYRLDHLKELVRVRYFNERTVRVPATDYVNRGRVLNSDFPPQFLVGIHFRRELTLGIDHEWQIDLVLSRKPLREILQSIGSDLRLVLEDEVAELIAQLLRLRIEVARDDG